MIDLAALAGTATKAAATSGLSWFIEEYKKYDNVHETFQVLETSLKSAEKLLQPLELSQDFKNLQDRVKELQRFCYELEDFIVDMKREIIKHDPTYLHRNNTRNAAKWFTNMWKPHQIHGMLCTLKHLTGEVETNQQLNKEGKAKVPSDGVEFVMSNLKYLGIEENTVLNIIEKLISDDYKGVSIVCIRGLGKKALAKYILDTGKVRDEFPLIIKASFSGNFFRKEDLKNLEIIYDEDSVHLSGQNNVLLKKPDQQWLLWMDDMSHMSWEMWEEFKDSYVTNVKGKRKVLVTTQNPEVAETTETFMYCMNELSDTCCQDLINETLKTRNLSCESFKFDSIRIVAEKCYGSPFIAKHLGLALCRHIKDYQHIVDEELWCLSEFKEALLPYLASSFQSLKDNSLKCFYYLSLFPQVHRFHKEDLIHLWIGIGLIPTEACNLSFLTNPDCFKDLLKSSILQPLSTEQGRGYQMNKFSHNFAQFAAPKIYVRWNEGSQPADLNNVDICHLSFTCNIPPQNSSSKQNEALWEKIKTRKCLRSFLSIYDETAPGQLNDIPPDLFKMFTKLRVLVLKNTNIRTVPSLTSLKLLRLLDISMTHLDVFPDLTSHNLQILKFKRRGIPLDLPRNFNELKNLVFVDWEVDYISKLRSKPAYIGKLINLETLPLFVVGKDKGYHIKELKNMNRLQNSICISKLENIACETDAEEAEIGMKTSLEKLKLQWTISGINISFRVLSGLKPHDKLRELYIEKYDGRSFPPWFSEPSFALRKVHLKECTKCDELPSFSVLPALEEIHLEKMPCLQSISKLLCGTSLKSLILSDMEALHDWKEENVKVMPAKPRELKLGKCKQLKSLPTLAHLTSVVIEDCEALLSLPNLPSSVKSLIIDKSSQLTSWCESQGWCEFQGNDWPKVNHNGLKVTIDGKLYKYLGFAQNHCPQQGSVSIAPHES